MQTDSVFACNVEDGDWIVLEGKVLGQHEGSPNDTGDWIHLIIRDEDGDVTEYPFGPFDTVNVVTSFEDDDVLDVDVEVDDDVEV